MVVDRAETVSLIGSDKVDAGVGRYPETLVKRAPFHVVCTGTC
jgi:hypothetical protein